MSKELSPKATERLQSVGIFLLALSVPFVLCWALLRGIFQTILPRKPMSERDADRQFKLAEWRDAELDRFRAMFFSQLSGLPPRLDIAPPRELNAPRFVVAKRTGDNGGVEIQLSVRRKFLIFETFSGPRFEMLPDGRVISEDNFSPED